MDCNIELLYKTVKAKMLSCSSLGESEVLDAATRQYYINAACELYSILEMISRPEYLEHVSKVLDVK